MVVNPFYVSRFDTERGVVAWVPRGFQSNFSSILLDVIYPEINRSFLLSNEIMENAL